MGSVVRVVNPNTYGFVQSIAAKFDQTKFPEYATRPLIQDSRDPTIPIDGIKKDIAQIYDPDERKWQDCTERKTEVLSGRHICQHMVEELPLEMIGEIAAKANNFSEWTLILRLTDPEITQQPVVIDMSAKELLTHLGIRRNHQSEREQLLTIVFEEAFKSYSLDEQLALIEKMRTCKINTNELPFKSQLSLSFRMRLIAFKVQIFVARIFSHPKLTFIVSAIIAWKTAKYYSAAKTFYNRYAASYYLPKAMNLLINHAPIRMLPVISGVIGVIQYVAKRQLRLSFMFLGIRLIAGQYEPYIHTISKIVLFPSTLSSFVFRSSLTIFVKAFGFSKSLQQEISERAKKTGERQGLEALIEETPHAYQLWMYLMLNPENLYTKQVRQI